MWQTLNMFRGMAPLRVLLDPDCLNRLPINYDGRPRKSLKRGSSYYEDSEDETSDYELDEIESEDEMDAALLTDAQVREMKAAFSMLDKNQDGRVNASEIKCMLDSLGILLSDEMIHNLIQDASKRDDDLISEDEFMNWMARQTGAQDDDVMEDLLAAFRVFDKDRNGFITKDELRIAMEMIGEAVSETQLDDMLKATDIDNDGRINYEEFVRILL